MNALAIIIAKHRHLQAPEKHNPQNKRSYHPSFHPETIHASPTLENVGEGLWLGDGGGDVDVAENQAQGIFVFFRGDDDRVHHFHLNQLVFVRRILNKILPILRMERMGKRGVGKERNTMGQRKSLILSVMKFFFS